MHVPAYLRYKVHKMHIISRAFFLYNCNLFHQTFSRETRKYEVLVLWVTPIQSYNHNFLQLLEVSATFSYFVHRCNFLVNFGKISATCCNFHRISATFYNFHRISATFCKFRKMNATFATFHLNCSKEVQHCFLCH